MDFGLQLAAMLCGETIAQQIQLHLEYSPAPPFHSGSPDTAPKDVVETVRRAAQSRQQERWKAASEWRNNRLTQRDPAAGAAAG
jgi:cyclohexyl-isocyanide hydratase